MLRRNVYIRVLYGNFTPTAREAEGEDRREALASDFTLRRARSLPWVSQGHSKGQGQLICPIIDSC